MLSGLFSSPTPVLLSRLTPVALASTPTTTPIPTHTPIPTPSSDPTEEYIKALTATVAALSTLAAEDQDQPTATGFSPEEPVNQMDGAELALIPAGEFTMGSEPKSDPYFWGAEYPPHQVALQDYWIYRTEVTNAMYLFCVQSRGCPELPQSISRTRPEYYGNPQYDNYPVIYVSYLGATAYCQWARGRLPTEAEWEKAARGSDGRLYPWGQDPPSIEQANFNDNSYQDTAPVGSFPAGASPYGLLDMAGNVWEWVFDWFSTDYYQSSPSLNPQGPESGTNHVIRGGSWFNPEDALRTVTRASLKPGSVLDTVGFRCAIDTE
jgi:formylglycine-generating enzyme required for sulfatase activity